MAAVVGLVFLAILGRVWYVEFGVPIPPLPVPGNLDSLEPQLRAYITEKIAWAQAAPRQAFRHSTVGMVYAANDLWSEALAAFTNAIRLNPREPLAHLYAAVACQEMGNTDEARRRLWDLTTRFPRFAPGYYRLGDTLARAGEYDQAAVAFQHLIELAPLEWRGFAGLGDCLTRQGHLAEAVKRLEKAVRLDPQARLAHHLLGQAYRRLGRAEEAKRELRLGLDAPHYPMPDAWSVLAPQHMKLIQDQLEMAREYTEAGQPTQAVVILTRALAFRPTNLSLLNNLGIALQRSNQPQQARNVFLKALKVDPRYVPAWVGLSASCLALDRKQEALDYANRAIELSPNQTYPHIAKANALLAMERDEETVVELEAALRGDPRNAQLHVELGDVLLRNLTRPLEALDHYRKARELDPTLTAALLRLADLALDLGQTNEAKIALEEARALTSNAPALNVVEKGLWKGRR